MENEVSGIAKLGIVLIALAVLIGLGFGIFQISKGTANTGVNNVQSELDGVASSTFTTYDQTTITGTMASSAVSDFEGENIAVLISTKAWVNLLSDKAGAGSSSIGTLKCGDSAKAASGMAAVYGTDSTTKVPLVPLVVAYNNKDLKTGHEYTAQDSRGTKVQQVFVNYNALLGTSEGTAAAPAAGTISGGQIYKSGTSTYNMACIYFDNNCFRTDCGFMTDASGRVLFNNITGNISRSGRTEYVPSSGKFDCFLIKDSSDTPMGITMQQL